MFRRLPLVGLENVRDGLQHPHWSAVCLIADDGSAGEAQLAGQLLLRPAKHALAHFLECEWCFHSASFCCSRYAPL